MTIFEKDLYRYVLKRYDECQSKLLKEGYVNNKV